MFKNKKGDIPIMTIFVVIICAIVAAMVLSELRDGGGIISYITDKFNPGSENVDFDADQVLSGLDDCDCDKNKGMGEKCADTAKCDQLKEINAEFDGLLRGPWTEDLVKEFFQCTPYTLFTKEAKTDRIKKIEQFWARIKEKSKEGDNAACKRMRLFFDDQISALEDSTGEKVRCQERGKSCVKQDDLNYYYVCTDGTNEGANVDGCLASEICCERLTITEYLEEFDNKLQQCASDFDACDQATDLLTKMNEIGTLTMNYDTEKLLLTTKKKLNEKSNQEETSFNAINLIEISSDTTGSTNYQGSAAGGIAFMEYLGNKKFKIVVARNAAMRSSITMEGELQLIRPTDAGKKVEFAFGKLTEAK